MLNFDEHYFQSLINKHFLLFFQWNCSFISGKSYRLLGGAGSLVPLSLSSSLQKSIGSIEKHDYESCDYRRYSTISKSKQQSLPQHDLLSFIQSTINKHEGPSHCWLNGIALKKNFFKKEGITLVLVAEFFQGSSLSQHDLFIMLDKVKLLQQRGLKSPIIYQGKEMDSMILDDGCISVDEKGNRVFVSDSNHHRIIVFDANGEILDCIGSSPGFEDGDFENAKLMRPAASFYHAADNCLYIADSELADLMDPGLGLRGSPRNCGRYGSHCQGTSLLVACYYIINYFLYTEGFLNISEICGHLILEKSNILKQIPNDLLKQLMHTDCSLEGIPYADLISSIATFQDDLIICNTGKVDIKLSIDIPESFELVEPLNESCIWRQARGAATVVSEAERISTSEKVCAAQQWYDELDHRTFWESEVESNKEVYSSTEPSVEVLSSSPSEVVPEGKVLVDCCINTSPGTSEVIISAALYLKLRKTADSGMDSREQKAAKIADSLDPTRRVSKDLLVSYLLASKRDLEGLVVTRPLQVRLKFECPNHPTSEDNSKEIIITDSSINVSVSLFNP
nr:uncharacterized protein LOC109190975 isoform X1 [Ipomoea trifida]